MSEAPHILVVDDDRDIRTLLSDYLQKNGYRVTAVAEGKAMRRTLEQTHIDLIVLDLMLPGEDGLKLCRDLRAQSQMPVLMLTALGEEIDRVRRPGSRRGRLPAEAVQPARAGRAHQGDPAAHGAHAARSRPASGQRLRVRRLAARQHDAHALSRRRHADGVERRRVSAAFGAARLIATRVLSRAQLMELLRGRELDPFDRSIDVRISRLRQTLRDDARSPRIIKTIYGEGYVIGVPVGAVLMRLPLPETLFGRLFAATVAVVAVALLIICC